MMVMGDPAVGLCTVEFWSTGQKKTPSSNRLDENEVSLSIHLISKSVCFKNALIRTVSHSANSPDLTEITLEEQTKNSRWISGHIPRFLIKLMSCNTTKSYSDRDPNLSIGKRLITTSHTVNPISSFKPMLYDTDRKVLFFGKANIIRLRDPVPCTQKLSMQTLRLWQ